MAADSSSPDQAWAARATRGATDGSSFRQRYLAVLFKSMPVLPVGDPTLAPGRARGEATVEQMLASVAYRELPLGEFPGSGSDVAASVGLLRPSLGEAYARTVVRHMLARRGGAVIQSFGMSPRSVVEHCLDTLARRRRRDVQLLIVSLLFGWLFLPGTMLWLAALRFRSVIRPGAALQRAIPAGAVAAGALWLTVHGLPLGGWLGWYSRFVLLAPPAGWFIAKNLTLRCAVDLRTRLLNVLDSDPEASPPAQSPISHRLRARYRASLEVLDAEQDSNVLFYDGAAGVMGLGRRWGSWQLTEAVHGGALPFRATEIIDQVIANLLDRQQRGATSSERGSALIYDWVLVDTSNHAGRIQRLVGIDVEGFGFSAAKVRSKGHAPLGQDIRHPLGVQFSLQKGMLVVTLLVSVSVVGATLAVKVDAYALGPPLAQMLPPTASHWTQASTITRFRESEVPLIGDETVRLLARAALVCAPRLLERLGGALPAPEPFGLRQGWSTAPFSQPGMADDALRVVTPVLRAIYDAILEVMESHSVDTAQFTDGASWANPEDLVSSAFTAPS